MNRYCLFCLLSFLLPTFTLDFFEPINSNNKKLLNLKPSLLRFEAKKYASFTIKAKFAVTVGSLFLNNSSTEHPVFKPCGDWAWHSSAQACIKFNAKLLKRAQTSLIIFYFQSDDQKIIASISSCNFQILWNITFI